MSTRFFPTREQKKSNAKQEVLSAAITWMRAVDRDLAGTEVTWADLDDTERHLHRAVKAYMETR